MKIPRLADFRRKRRNPAAPFGGQGFRFYLGALALLLTGIVAGFYLFFPASALQQRLELEIAARTPLDARIEEVSLRFPLGLQGKGIHLAARNPAAASPPAGFTVTALELTPLWRTLIGSNPGLAFQAEVQGGQIDGSLWKNGSVEARLQRLSFSAPVGGAGVPLLLTGQLGKGEIAGAWPLQPTSETRLNLSFDSIELGGLTSLGLTSDALPLGTVSLVGSGRGNALKIERLTASGGSLDVTGEGTVMLSEPLARSRLNINLVLRPGRQLDRGFTDLLELFAQAEPDGSYRLRLTGPLTQVAIQ
jgi:type II secretion system protein N